MLLKNPGSPKEEPTTGVRSCNSLPRIHCKPISITYTKLLALYNFERYRIFRAYPLKVVQPPGKQATHFVDQPMPVSTQNMNSRGFQLY